MSLIDEVTGGAWALDKALAFTQARHRMLAENIANADTPGYRTKQLDVGAFQKALGQALEAQKEHPTEATVLADSNECRTDSNGRLIVSPGREPADNVLFHDGTNGRIERQMAMLAENGMMHQTLAELLRGFYAQQLKAIQGRVT